ncbi:chromosome alignment-maintaining phosphoprotein 1-like [Betta splendens]|uniref:Chromosome alignment-maintaining phosphoprotein 1-like n=1 Tax=Betta splendens TaxID=158456 RepID=A0A6P7KQL3_BETSP|nr:chromosome alignment-maintaining phosphoprotein 1-like [Betta splendens]XP_028984841.1 chromosome alignment-maintaining phosphoprotein 1-like [Betta splendens]XP_028984848.1 chromosome alignment-maintaining phosphoprotein 1-like [Betta splendens]
MSVIIQTCGEVGGGVTAHLQCPTCGHFSKSHAHQLSHMASAHPSCLDDVSVGRLGNILMFQSTARLFHCTNCFYTSRDFTKLYKHIITKHCEDDEVKGRQKEKTEEQGEEELKESLKRKRGSGADEEEGGRGDDEVSFQKQESVRELLKEEMEATAKVIRFVSNRFVCLSCGWKTKLKGFAISHVIRSHDVVRPYNCKDCTRSFFLPSHLQQHIRSAHRPGRYACPFCCFRSHFLTGFRRHCSRCNAREEEGGRGVGGGEDEEAEENEEEEQGKEERKDTRAERRRKRATEGVEEQKEDDESDNQ